MAEFRMPVLGADMDEGTVLEWLVKPGDEIRKGDVIAVIDTEKSAIDVEAFSSGTIERLLIDVGQTVPVGTVLALITESGQERAEAAAPAAPEQPAAAPPKAQAPAASPPVRYRARELSVDLASVPGTGPGGSVTRADVERAAAGPHPAPRREAVPEHPEAPGHRVVPEHRAVPQHAAPERARSGQGREHPAGRQRVSPRARVLAAELGVDLAAVTGTGQQGSVREADVRMAAAAAAPAAAPAARSSAERAQSMRQAIAKLMARSKREIPHYYVSNTADMTAALSWLRDRNRELDVSQRIVPAALLLKAAAVAALQVPQVNGYWVDEEFRAAEAVHLGLAISLRGGGLLTPAIHDAATLDLPELMNRMRDLVARARAGRLRGSELTDATITVTNLGDQGVESVFGVIYPPQVALVGFGKITERPVAVGGLVGARPAVVTTLAADHRATDGYTGARYLTAVADLLQRPEEL